MQCVSGFDNFTQLSLQRSTGCINKLFQELQQTVVKMGCSYH